MSVKNNNSKEIFSIAIKLLVICSIVATIIAAVNFITKDKIAYNEKLSTAKALTGIYHDDYGKDFTVSEDSFVITENDKVSISCSLENMEFSSKDVKALYVLKNAAGDVEGYCVSVQPMGFKDYIKMLVAINTDCTIKGVEIVSMSETSGIGTKAKEASFLNQFKNLNEKAVKSEVDVISGATKTSQPVIDAVSASLAEVSKYIAKNGGDVK
ncbi:MAG: FMN-binding protein [Clostridia bacterium]|nr:FMN-binding protein [Clostridia bacterium]